MPLFLPPVVIPIEDNEPFSYAPSVLSSMEQQCIIKQTRNDRDQALIRLSNSYRDLAETLKKEKRDIEHKLVSKIEIVRDFWRNKIVEVDSRGGKILRASLLQNK